MLNHSDPSLAARKHQIIKVLMRKRVISQMTYGSQSLKGRALAFEGSNIAQKQRSRNAEENTRFPLYSFCDN
jgi:hypothetical protein